MAKLHAGTQKKLEALGLAPHEIESLAILATRIVSDGALSVRHLEGIVIVINDEISRRME